MSRLGKHFAKPKGPGNPFYEKDIAEMEKATFEDRRPVRGGRVENFASVTSESTWLERKLKRTTYKTRYLFTGKPLLWMTCFFGSLGDALFGYDQGTARLSNG